MCSADRYPHHAVAFVLHAQRLEEILACDLAPAAFPGAADNEHLGERSVSGRQVVAALRAGLECNGQHRYTVKDLVKVADVLRRQARGRRYQVCARAGSGW